MGVIFISVSFFIQLFFPSIQRFHQPDAALPEIALYVGGKLFQSIFLCVTFINTLASGLASHASVSRLLYVMGRDNVFPEKFFGYIHPKWRTPALNVLMVGLVALSALSFDLVTATALINFGALVAFTFVNLSVISHFFIREGRNKSWKDRFNFLFLPLVGALTVGGAVAEPGEELADHGAYLGDAGLRLFGLVDPAFSPAAAAARAAAAAIKSQAGVSRLSFGACGSRVKNLIKNNPLDPPYARFALAYPRHAVRFIGHCAVEQRRRPYPQRQRRAGADRRRGDDLQRQRGVFAGGARRAEMAQLSAALSHRRQPAVRQL